MPINTVPETVSGEGKIKTLNRQSHEKDDVEQLKSLGWLEKDILDATYHGTTQVGVDKIFNAFKIEPEM